MQRFYIVFLSFLYTLFGQPFLFTSLHFGGRQYSLKLLVLILIIIYTYKKRYKCTNNVKSVFVIFSILSIVSAIYNYEFFQVTIFQYFDAIYFFCLIVVFINDTKFGDLIYKLDFCLVHFVAASTVLSFVAYLYNPSLFLTLDVDGYPVFYNRFVGTISAYNFRTCWYFAEPSYCGFYLGAHFMLYIGREYQSFFKKTLSLLLILSGLLVTASMGSAIYLVLSLVVFFAERIHINKKILLSCLYFSLITAIIILPSFDVYSVNQEVVDMKKSSFDDRQDRINLAIKMRQEMNITDYLFGCGVSAAAKQFGVGLSDAYNKLLCEQGLIYLFLFLFVVKKFIKDNLHVYTFVLFSYLSVIIHATPIVLLLYLTIAYQTNNSRCFSR